MVGQDTGLTPAPPLNELDAAAADALAVDGVRPRFEAAPQSEGEVAALLGEAAAQRLAIAPRGSGTKIGLGNPPAALDVLLNLRNVRGVVDYTPADMTVTVRAGTRLAELQAELAAHGQMLALDPPFAGEATIGGILSTNDSGARRLGYGTARDLVIGTRVACLDGRIAKAGGKVVKNVTGYDLNKLYIGSLGTLAVLVEASFKLHPLPRAMRTVWAAFPDAASAMAAVVRLTRSPLGPIALMLNDLRGSDMAEGDRAPLRLHVEFAGTAAALARKTEEARRYCREAGASETSTIDEGGTAAWTSMREHPRAFAAPGGVRLKVAVPVTEVAAVLDAARASASAAGMRYWALSFAGNGIVYVYFDGGTPLSYASIIGGLRALASAGGSGVIQQGSVALKRLVDVWGAAPSGLNAMKGLKEAYDPHGLLNPGRYVGGI